MSQHPFTPGWQSERSALANAARATDRFVYGTGDRNVIETLRYSAFVQARDLTAPEKRHLLRHEVDENWQLIALWCVLGGDA